jgi:hypothetical protein
MKVSISEVHIVILPTTIEWRSNLSVERISTSQFIAGQRLEVAMYTLAERLSIQSHGEQVLEHVGIDAEVVYTYCCLRGIFV